MDILSLMLSNAFTTTVISFICISLVFLMLRKFIQYRIDSRSGLLDYLNKKHDYVNTTFEVAPSAMNIKELENYLGGKTSIIESRKAKKRLKDLMYIYKRRFINS